MREHKSAGARRRAAAYRHGLEAGRKEGHAAAIMKIADVCEAVAFQAGAPGTEIAGLLVSALSAKPELIERFMIEGAELFCDGSLIEVLHGYSGKLTYRSANGYLMRPSTLREPIGFIGKSSCDLLRAGRSNGAILTPDPSPCVESVPVFIIDPEENGSASQ